LLERALEATGNDLDSAIKSLTDLHLEPEEINLASAVGALKDGIPVHTHPATEGICIFSLFYRYKKQAVYLAQMFSLAPQSNHPLPFPSGPSFGTDPEKKNIISSWLHVFCIWHGCQIFFWILRVYH
jgi:hypothetical protein